MNDYKMGSKCVQAGYKPGNGEPRQIPIIQSTTFKYDTSEDMGKLFDLEAEGYFYSRLQNPTCDHVAAKLAAMEGGTAAMLTSSGQAVAESLEAHPKVAYVNYPGLPSNKYYEKAQKYLPNGGCGVVSFGLKGGRTAASTFMQNLHLGAIETHVADARTCCLNPATSTHRQMTDEQLIEAGVPAELIRISLGLEDKEDLIADISNALDAI